MVDFPFDSGNYLPTRLALLASEQRSPGRNTRLEDATGVAVRVVTWKQLQLSLSWRVIPIGGQIHNPFRAKVEVQRRISMVRKVSGALGIFSLVLVGLLVRTDPTVAQGQSDSHMVVPFLPLVGELADST